MERNQQVLATAFKKAKRKIQRIKDLNIRPDLSEEEIDQIVTNLATAKALETEGKTVKDFLDGQQWYVEELIKASSMTGEELVNAEYDDSFADVATEAEMFDVLDALRAA